MTEVNTLEELAEAIQSGDKSKINLAISNLFCILA